MCWILHLLFQNSKFDYSPGIASNCQEPGLPDVLTEVRWHWKDQPSKVGWSNCTLFLEFGCLLFCHARHLASNSGLFPQGGNQDMWSTSRGMPRVLPTHWFGSFWLASSCDSHCHPGGLKIAGHLVTQTMTGFRTLGCLVATSTPWANGRRFWVPGHLCPSSR